MRTPKSFLAFAFVCLAFAYSSAFDCTSAEPFRFKELNQNSLGLFEGTRPVLVYNHGVSTNASFPKAAAHSAYVHPIYGLNGEILTGDFPKDHVYHRGLYWAWPHIEIAGKEYDLWSLRGIEQRFQKWIFREVSLTNATLTLENAWVVGEKKVMREQVTFRVHPARNDGRAINIELSWTPLEEPITLWGAPEKSYGGLTFRFADRAKTIITTPKGRTEEDSVMAKLPWADLSADFQKDMSGVSIFVDRDHLNYPPEWMLRHYGVLAVGMPGVNRKTFAPNETFTCRYRIWIHRGNPDAATIQSQYDKYLSEGEETTNSSRR